MRLMPVINNMPPSEQSKSLEIFADFGNCVSNSIKSGVSPKSSGVESVFVVSLVMPLLSELSNVI